MFIHNFKYTFKTLLRNKPLIFWTFAFTIILGTLFFMAFSGISSTEKFKKINIAVINNKEYNDNLFLKEAIFLLSNENSDNQIFNTSYVSKDEADSLLTDEKIDGYLILEDSSYKIIVNRNGINQTIFKFAIEEIIQKNDVLNNVINSKNFDFNKLNEVIDEIINSDTIKLNNIANNNLDYMMIEFYTLIAMTCLYGSLFGMTAINHTMANISNVGKRVSIAPTKKGITVLSSLLASFIIQLIGVTLLFIYTIFVLKINYGNNLFLTILLAIIGSFAGQSLGIFVGSIFKTSENSKVGFLIAIIMTYCFFSGMMGVMMKYVIDTNIPIINIINPVNMITDGFYALYYYATFDRYWFNIISLIIYSVILTIISFIVIRRQKYDSI